MKKRSDKNRIRRTVTKEGPESYGDVDGPTGLFHRLCLIAISWKLWTTLSLVGGRPYFRNILWGEQTIGGYIYSLLKWHFYFPNNSHCTLKYRA
jgi:hypothetical protein